MDPNNSQSNNNSNPNDTTIIPNVDVNTSVPEQSLGNLTPIENNVTQQPVSTIDQVTPPVIPLTTDQNETVNPVVPQQYPTFSSTEANQSVDTNQMTQPVTQPTTEPLVSSVPTSPFIETQSVIDQPQAPMPIGTGEPEKKKMSVMNMVLLIMAAVLIIVLGYIAFAKLTTKVSPENSIVPAVVIEPTEEPMATEIPVVVEDVILPTEIPATDSAEVIPTVSDPTPTPAQ